jgi:hypothetical protein
MNQALYTHMNNKRKMKEKKKILNLLVSHCGHAMTNKSLQLSSSALGEQPMLK